MGIIQEINTLRYNRVGLDIIQLMKHLDTRKRLLAAEKLLREETTTQAKFEAIRTLIKGLDPKLDKTLAQASKAIKTVTKIHKGKVVDLATEALPEGTKQQKKRKKALLLFLKYWGQLRHEVRRVTKLLEAEEGKHLSRAEKGQTAGKIVAYAKGPLGVVTLAAAAIAAGLIALKSMAVEVVIINQGCQALSPSVSVPINLPGLKLPDQPIPNGGRATAVLPPLTFGVEDLSGRNLRLTAYGISLSFETGGDTDIVFNGESLMGKRTQINLGAQKQHQVMVRCR